jgi:DNA primase
MNDPVLDLIQKQGHPYQISGKDYLIKCLNPEHPDSNPSLRVDKVSGSFHCFACHFKGNLFKFYNVFTNQTPIRVAKLKEKLDAIKSSSTGLDIPKGATPYNKAFRGVSAKTLRHFEAFYTLSEEKLADRICFPIKDITDKTVVYVARHMLSGGNPRYVNYPSGVTMPLYPPAAPRGEKSIVLVEGIFDMLNLYDKGLHSAVCCFGTNTLHKDTKQKLMPFKAQGVTHIYLLFDGDEAGRKAAEALKPILEECEFVVEIIGLPDDTDPGELDQENVSSIAEYIKK